MVGRGGGVGCGSGVQSRGGGGVGEGGRWRGVRLGQRLGHHGLGSGRGVGGDGRSSGVGRHGGSGVGSHGGGGVRSHRRDYGTADQRLSQLRRGGGGGSIQLGFHSLDVVDGPPGVVLGGVGGAALQLGGLVVRLAAGVGGGAQVVGRLGVRLNGGAGDVARADGGQRGGQHAHRRRGCGARQHASGNDL
ncbi:unnamed protein product [Plutella xylostella]|uniref:(diamondback moth) hypothetical protein n=1 Tax=Plutella xylostella TaxID=51655 RepID=A0A8S4G166_PLUXY|nr:unnamed protein product [Plutella xylostella]